MNGPQDRPQAPQSPVPAGDALGPPDTHTDVQSVSVREMLEWTLDAYPEDIWPTPPPELQAKDAAAAHVIRSVALPIIREALDEIDRLQALAAAGLLCTPAEREQLNRLHHAPIDLARKGSWLIEDAVALLDYLLHGSPLDEIDREARS